MADYPPDDFTKSIIEWLQYEIYPGLLQEPWTARAEAVWVAGDRGFVGMWVAGVASDLAPVDRLEALRAELYRRIYAVKFRPEPVAVDPTPHLPGPIGHRRIVGRLRRSGQVFYDDAGVILPLFWHFGEAFSAWVRRPEDVKAELIDIRDTGYHGIRFWDVLGFYDQNRPGDPNQWKAWSGREVTPVEFTAFSGRTIPATPRYYDQLRDFLAFCDSIGLYVHHDRGDLCSWRGSQVEQHAAMVDDVTRSVNGGVIVALNAGANEPWQNLPFLWRDDIPKHLKLITDKFGVGALKGSGAADDGYGGELPESVKAYTVDLDMDVHIVHGYRGGDSWNRIGHIHALGYETLPEAGVPGWQGEPAGPGDGVSVGREESAEALCLMAAMSLATRQGYVAMSGAGVFWNSRMSTMTGYREVARVPSLLPPDVMKFRTIIHGGERFRGVRVLAGHPGHERDSSPFYRADHVIHDDGTFVAFVYGGPGSYRVPVERTFEGVIITPHTGETHPFSASAGTAVDIAFDRGRIIVGKV